MRMWMLAAGAAALAITAPALADAQDRGGGRAKAEQSKQRGGGQAKAQARSGRGDSDRGRAIRQARQGGGDRDRGRAVRFSSMQRGDDDRGRGRGQARVRDDDRQGRNVEARARVSQDRDDRRAARVQQRVDRGDDRRVVAREIDDDRRIVARNRDDVRRILERDRAGDRIVIRTRDGERRIFARTRLFDDDDRRIVRRAFDFDPFPGRGRGLIAGCPPGLAKKDNGCMPPGQVRNLLGVPLARTAFANSLLPFSQRSFFRDDDDFLFRAGDGFIYRVDRDNGLIDGLIPMFGSGYYALGDPWPGPYNFYNVPYQYRSMYFDDDDDCYRYDGFGAIYRTDCDNGLVTAIAALLAGDLGVGSRLPLGYDAYNVPLAYRATYYDTPTAWYRYNDGYIYRVDPTTRLVTAVIDALV